MEKDLWMMIDEVDAHNYGNIVNQLKQDMEKSVQATIDKSPETVRRDIGNASDNLYEKMDQFAQAEQDYVPSPETWLEYEPKHAAIKENLENLQDVQEKANSEQEVMVASDKTVASFQQASVFLQTEYEKLMERERQVWWEMEQIKNIIDQMHEQAIGSSSEKMQRLAANGEKFIADIENFREGIRWKKPVIAAALWKEAREQAKQVYTGIQKMPNKIKASVQDKAYSMVDQAVEKARQEKSLAAEQQLIASQNDATVKDKAAFVDKEKPFDRVIGQKRPRKMILRVEDKGKEWGQERERERLM